MKAKNFEHILKIVINEKFISTKNVFHGPWF